MTRPGDPCGELLLGYAAEPVVSRVRARLGESGGAHAEEKPDGGAAPDWDRIVDRHRREPLADHVCAEYVAREDCPRHAVLALVVPGAPYPVPRLPRAFEVALRRGLVTPRQVVMEAAPGWSALWAVAAFAYAPTGERVAAIDRLLDEAAALLPGDDVDAWLWLISRTPHYPGTFPQLCAEASSPSRGSAAAPGLRPAKPPAQRWVGLSPLAMLGRTSPDVAAHVIAALPDDTLTECLRVHEKLPSHVVFPLLRRLPARTSDLIHNLRLDPAVVRELLARRAPGINAALLSALPDPATRHAVFDATRRDAPRRVRLRDADRSWLRIRLPDDCAESVYGHHPDLIRVALSRASELLGTAGVLRALLGIWETRGRMAVYDPRLTDRLGADHPAFRYVRSLTRDPRGLERLRTEVARHETPAAMLAAMRATPVLARRHPPHADAFWPEAVAAHAREPLPTALLANLAAHPDCPDTLTLAACRTNPAPAPRLACHSPEHARTALAHPLHITPFPAGGAPRPLTEVPWYLNALADDLLTVREFVERAHPARHVLEAVQTLRLLHPDGHHEARHLIAAHTTRDLADNPDAWAVALRLAPDFPGTVPELTTTAAAVFR